MIKVCCPDLPDELQTYLADRCSRDAAWNSLRGSPRAERIKAALRQAFHDKCGYCEQIEARTVDHFWPKESAEHRWDWWNFILACDVCQGYKLDRHPIDQQGHWMVNPRRDEPLNFLFFDLETGYVAPFPISEEAAARGRLTIEILHLEQREQLTEARQRQVLDVLYYIGRIVRPNSEADTEEAWERLCDHLQPASPYLGPLRQLLHAARYPSPKMQQYARLIEALRRARPEIDALLERCWPPVEGIMPASTPSCQEISSDE